MATENPEGPTEPAEKTEPAVESKPFATNEAKTIHTGRRWYHVSTLAIALGSVVLLGAGALMGYGVAHHTFRTHIAAATTKGPKTLPPNTDAVQQGTRDSSQTDIFQQFAELQQRMDKVLDQMTTQLNTEPELANPRDETSYSLALHLTDAKDHLEVRGNLPNATSSNVKVRLLNPRTLQVDVNLENDGAASAHDASSRANVDEWAHYAQIIELPKAVKGEQTEVNQSKHELLVKLPC